MICKLYLHITRTHMLIPLYVWGEVRRGWELEFELRACKEGILPLKPHFPSILLWLIRKWGLMKYLPRLALNLE
jgi:hypothetical protein